MTLHEVGSVFMGLSWGGLMGWLNLLWFDGLAEYVVVNFEYFNMVVLQNERIK